MPAKLSLKPCRMNTCAKTTIRPGMVVLSSGESHQQDELSPVNTVEPERRISLHRIHFNQPNAIRINTYAEFPRNPRVMNTYAIAQFESLLE